MSQPAICCGDQSSSSLEVTSAASAGEVASLVALGRAALDHAALSAAAARYLDRPPLPKTSRLTVDGARPRAAAIIRNDSPAASPREISSRSSSDSRTSQRRFGAGLIPPLRCNRSRTVDGLTRICRAKTFTAWPERHRTQTSSTSTGVSLNGLLTATTPFAPTQEVLRRPIETTGKTGWLGGMRLRRQLTAVQCARIAATVRSGASSGGQCPTSWWASRGA